jgi:hypothetical protein
MQEEVERRTDGLITHKLHVGMLKDLDLEVYPPFRTHYLAYALQFGLKLPSVATMNRCEKRNQQKAGVDKAN